MPAPVYHLRLTKHTGMLLMARRVTRTYSGSFEECVAAYKEVLAHNLTFGWWSLFSLAWNPMTLHANAKAFKTLKRLNG